MIKKGFTLVELLTVIVIVSVLSAILFPVFAQVRGEAQKDQCLSNFHQVGIAVLMYSSDYDDMAPIVNQNPPAPSDPNKDLTWVQLVLPYVATLRVFECPADPDAKRQMEGVFDEDLESGNLNAEYYKASLHSDVGYNYAYLCPILVGNSGWVEAPRSLVGLAKPSSTLMFVDSAWSTKNGVASGGGSWLVSPPCRYAEGPDGLIDTFLENVPSNFNGSGTGERFYANDDGWALKDGTQGDEFGGAWPRHFGRATVLMTDGSSREMSISELGSGCAVEPNWEGLINEPAQYYWYPQ